MTNILLDFYEKRGVEFLSNLGSGISCKYENKEYKFYPNNPFKLFSRVDGEHLDFMKEIRSDKAWKVAYSSHIDDKMIDLFERDDKDLYDVIVDVQDLGNHPKEVERFISNYDILKVQSPMATRKSNIIEEIIKQANENNLRVIMVTNRVSLSKDISSKYSIPNYKDIEYDEKFNEGNEHLVVQFDSLHRFDVQKFDICILDEVSSLLSYTTSKHNDEYYKMNVIKLMALGTHKKLAMLDAFIIDYPWKGRRELGILNNFREKHEVFLYDYKTTFVNKIMNDVRHNRNISVSSNEKGFLEKISIELKSLKIRHVLLTGDTTERERKKIYRAFRDKDLDIPVILYSPTLTVGVSIMSEKIQNHYHHDVGGTTSTIDSIQMIRRSRNADKIHIFLRARSSILSTELEDIEYGLVDFIDIDDFGNRKSISFAGRLFARVKQMSNIMKNGSKYSLIYLLKYQFEKLHKITRSSK